MADLKNKKRARPLVHTATNGRATKIIREPYRMSDYFEQHPESQPVLQLFSPTTALDWQHGQLEPPSHLQPVASQLQFGSVQLSQQSQAVDAFAVEATDESQTHEPPLSQLQFSSSQAQEALLQFWQQSQHELDPFWTDFRLEPHDEEQLELLVAE